jgi:hypothetical protein
MSHIPNSAMPHAAPAEGSGEDEAKGPPLSERAGKLADKARENPKTAIAAGAAVLAGVAAAAAIPLVRKARSGGGTKSGSKGGTKKGGTSTKR